MAYQLVQDGNYPGTDLPLYKVFDADEYNDPTVKYPHPIGDVWGVGVRGVAGKFVPTGVRWEINGSLTLDDSNLLPAGAYADAARAMIRAYEGI
jgi:hypothetical protein